jgi:hypothetical protein
MTTTRLTRLTTPLTLTAATLAALFLLQDARAVTPVAMPVVTLDPVHVTGRSLPAVVQLPRVDVIARRVAAPAMQVVQLPAVEVTARRADASPRIANAGQRAGAEARPL